MERLQTVEASEAERIADQLERAFEGDAWLGPSVSEILADVSAEQAASRPLAGTHSIWEIVRHMTAWQRTVRERLQGRPSMDLPDDEDWPALPDVTDAAWAATLQELRLEYELLRDETLSWAGRDMVRAREGERFTAYEMLHGVIQHSVYHAGQIAVLKKAPVETAVKADGGAAVR